MTDLPLPDDQDIEPPDAASTYAGRSYAGPAYPDPSHPDLAYPDPTHTEAEYPHHTDAGYPDQGHTDRAYQDSAYSDTTYPDAAFRNADTVMTYPGPAHAAQGYPDRAHSDRAHSDQTYPEQDFADPEQGHTDPGYPDSEYPDSEYPDSDYPESGYSGEPRLPRAHRAEPASSRRLAGIAVVLLAVVAVAAVLVWSFSWAGRSTVDSSRNLHRLDGVPATFADQTPGVEDPAMSASAMTSASANASPSHSGSPSARASSGAPLTVKSYEAEAAGNLVGGTATVRRVQGASGGFVVTGIGGSGNILRFTSVNVASAGSYQVTVYFAAGDARTATIRVNGGSASSYSFGSSGGPKLISSRVVTLNLVAGRNTVEFGNPSSAAPDIDRLVIG